MKSFTPFPFRSQFLSLLVSLIFLSAGLSTQAAIVIDDFTVTQTETASDGGTATGSGIIGGERDVAIYNDTAEVHINSTFGSGCRVIDKVGDSDWGYAYLSYDGIDGSISDDTSGLGHLDLTGAGQYDGFLIMLTQINGRGNMSFWVSQGDSQYGYEYVTLPGDPQSVFVPFADFGLDVPASLDEEFPAGDTLVDFADVGYIGINFGLAPDSSCTIGSITVVPEPTSLALLVLGGLMLRRRK
jgi:hypothetical protein